MTDWSKLLTKETKKMDWGSLLEGPKLSSSIPASSSLTPIAKPDGDLPQFEVPKLKPIDPTGKEIFTPDINVFRSYEEGLRQKNQRVTELADYGLDMYDNNPIKVLTMTEDDGVFRPSKTRLNKALKEQFGDAFDNEMFEQSVVDMKKRARSLLGDDWASRYYHNAEKSIDQSFDLKDSLNERITQDAYEYVSSKGMFDETDQKRAEINLQIKAEQDKSIEEGRDPLKIQSLRSKLSALGESYIDEEGNVIDPKTKTPEQEEYISSVQRYKEQHSISDEDKLKEAFYNTYKFTRSVDELYEMDVKPWLDQQISTGTKPGAYPHVPYMPKDLKHIIDQRREAHAELTALSKL